jgi:hypothetical protein
MPYSISTNRDKVYFVKAKEVPIHSLDLTNCGFTPASIKFSFSSREQKLISKVTGFKPLLEA